MVAAAQAQFRTTGKPAECCISRVLGSVKLRLRALKREPRSQALQLSHIGNCFSARTRFASRTASAANARNREVLPRHTGVARGAPSPPRTLLRRQPPTGARTLCRVAGTGGARRFARQRRYSADAGFRALESAPPNLHFSQSMQYVLRRHEYSRKCRIHAYWPPLRRAAVTLQHVAAFWALLYSGLIW